MVEGATKMTKGRLTVSLACLFGFVLLLAPEPMITARTQSPQKAELDGIVAWHNGSYVQISWDGDSEAKVTLYNVYRSTDLGVSWEKLNTELLESYGFVDYSAPKEVTVLYKVTAIGNDGSESERRPVVRVDTSPFGSLTADETQGFLANNLTSASILRAALEHPNGWLYPAGSSNYQYLSWLCYNSAFNGYHLAQDMANPQGDPVYAVDSGDVIYSSSCVGGYGGPSGGTCGGALVIQHRAKDGTWFTALYGHLDNPHGLGHVYFGDVIGYSNNWNPPHVHFGVRLGYGVADSNPYRGYTSSTSNLFGYTKPVTWTSACGTGTGFLESYFACRNGSSVNFRPNNNAPVHPNGTLIKSTTDGTVYLIRNGQKQAIASPIVLRNLYPNGGFDFKDVITVAQDEWNSYQTGSVITSQLSSNGRTHAEGRLIRRSTGGEISIVTDNGMRRPFVSSDVFLNLGYLFCNVVDATDANYDSYPEGAPVTGTSGGCLGDLGEPNDSFSQAYPISCNATTAAKICSGTDIDYYRFTPSSSGNSTITLTPPSDKDYDLYIYNSSQQQICSSTNGTGSVDSCTVPVTGGQSYYGRVIGFSGAFSTTNSYGLGVSCPSCAAPGAFSLSAPTNGQILSPTTSATLSWGTSANADSYDVYFGTSSNPPFLANQPSTSRLVSVTPGQTYYWKVVARVNCSSSLTFTAGIWSFSVQQNCNAPGSFSLSSPSNGQSLGPTTSTTLSWGASANADSYDVYFGTSSNPPFLANQTGLSRSVTVSPGQTYFWKVVARVNCSSSLTFTAGIWSFSVQQNCNAPGSFSLISPTNGQSLSPTTSATLSWGASANANSYDVYFGTSSNPPFLANQTGLSRSVTVSPGQNYFWKVVARVNCSSSLTFTAGTSSFSVQSSTLADLMVTSLTAPTTGGLGGQITVSVTVANQGSANAGTFRVGFYFSSDSTITTGDTFTEWFCDFPSGLAAGTQSTCGGPIGVPSSLPPGTYYFGAIVDDLGQIAENNEANNARSADTGPIGLTGHVGKAKSDIDGDAKTDIGFYRNGVWSFLQSSQNYGFCCPRFFSWGGAGVQPILADFDGDSRADLAYIVPPSGGQSAAYAILKSTANYDFSQALFVPAGFPSLGDTPVVADFDGDGKADPGIWRSSQGVWIIPLSSMNYSSFIFTQWGQAGDIALPNGLNLQ